MFSFSLFPTMLETFLHPFGAKTDGGLGLSGTPVNYNIKINTWNLCNYYFQFFYYFIVYFLFYSVKQNYNVTNFNIWNKYFIEILYFLWIKNLLKKIEFLIKIWGYIIKHYNFNMITSITFLIYSIFVNCILSVSSPLNTRSGSMSDKLWELKYSVNSENQFRKLLSLLLLDSRTHFQKFCNWFLDGVLNRIRTNSFLVCYLQKDLVFSNFDKSLGRFREDGFSTGNPLLQQWKIHSTIFVSSSGLNTVARPGFLSAYLLHIFALIVESEMEYFLEIQTTDFPDLTYSMAKFISLWEYWILTVFGLFFECFEGELLFLGFFRTHFFFVYPLHKTNVVNRNRMTSKCG